MRDPIIPYSLVIEDERAAYAARYHQIVPGKLELKRMVIKAYGGRCACCGIESLHELTIDHISPVLGGSRKNYLALWREGFPRNNLQLLCEPCNSSKAASRECRHALMARHITFNFLSTLRRLKEEGEAISL